MFECGLLCNKLKEYMATSLDGWLIIRYESSDDEKELNSTDSEDKGWAMDHSNYNCGLEIMTPSSKKILHTQIRNNIDLYGMFSQCE